MVVQRQFVAHIHMLNFQQMALRPMIYFAKSLNGLKIVIYIGTELQIIPAHVLILLFKLIIYTI